MKTLGISAEHDAGVAVVAGGRLRQAANEERYTGQKFHYGFPYLALDWLSQTGRARQSAGPATELTNSRQPTEYAVAVASVFHVARQFGNWQQMSLPFQVLEQWLHWTGLDRRLWGSELGPWLLRQLSQVLNWQRRQQVLAELDQRQLRASQVQFIDHHLCHAATAYYTSGWSDCLVITQDASGDGYCSKVYTAAAGQLTEQHRIPFFHSPGHYYEYVTLLFGFKIGREGKVTGLAALGDPTQTYPIFARLHQYDPVAHRFDNLGQYRHAGIRQLKQLLAGYRREDIAAGVQKHLESVMTAYITDMIKRYGQPPGTTAGHWQPVRLAVAGGVFANVKLNQRIAALPLVKELYVYPHMGDGGLAAGAALYLDAQRQPQSSWRPQTLPHVYLGPKPTVTEIKTALRRHQAELQVTAFPTDRVLAQQVAALLAAAKTVAVVQDEMEYGPRALGHRSILYQATDPTVNDWLNQKLNRSEFMPFAPILKASDVKHYFTDWQKVSQPLQYMTVTLGCNARCQREAPAIVHKDLTARPQLVTRQHQPFIYQVLTAYTKLTGQRILINTSFNMHESPIVRTAEDAVTTFLQSQLDVLVLNHYLLQRQRS